MKAIWEYKKFVYLGVISDFSVTPSKVIDQVWHEHILFTSGYRKFCKDVIQYDFDHNPELVAVDRQMLAHESQYIQTIQLYKRNLELNHQMRFGIQLNLKRASKIINNQYKIRMIVVIPIVFPILKIILSMPHSFHFSLTQRIVMLNLEG